MTPTAAPRPRLWIVSELYYPELASTGWYMTHIAEGLAQDFRVNVICARPNYAARGVAAPDRESRNGVAIRRCRTFAFDTYRLLSRIAGALLITVAMTLTCLRHVRRGDVVLVVTNPPLLPYAVAVVAMLRCATSILYIQDLYPDAAIHTGMLRANGFAAQIAHRTARWLYDRVDLIVTDGRDALRMVKARTRRPEKVHFIPYWGENWPAGPPVPGARPDAVITILYSGTMGRMHDLETPMRAAFLLRDDSRIRWVFRGAGAARAWAEAFARDHNLSHVSFEEPCAWEGLRDALAACDLGLISYRRGAAGISTPSRMYNLLAAAKPILAVSDEDAELTMLVRETGAGWVVSPGQPEQLASLVRHLAEHPDEVVEAGKRAHAAAAQYTAPRSIAVFRDLVRQLAIGTAADETQ